MGWMAILGSVRGLVSVTLPQSSAQEALNLLGEMVNLATPSSERFKDLIQRLKDYFSGKKVSFPDKLDLSTATPFQRQVWQVTKLIPYGETRSYRWVAERMGKPEAMRAVGQALTKNPLPIIIPCHRVVKSDGELGGFTGGVEMKRRLLNIEAAATLHQR
jgi:methylated-DNA-[protein]-cysteine S-methyltransferase